MNYFTKEVPWTVWQFGLLKLCMIALGIIVGAYFADFWRPFLWLLGIFFLVTTIWITMLWWRAVNRSA